MYLCDSVCVWFFRLLWIFEGRAKKNCRHSKSASRVSLKRPKHSMWEGETMTAGNVDWLTVWKVYFLFSGYFLAVTKLPLSTSLCVCEKKSKMCLSYTHKTQLSNDFLSLSPVFISSKAHRLCLYMLYLALFASYTVFSLMASNHKIKEMRKSAQHDLSIIYKTEIEM